LAQTKLSKQQKLILNILQEHRGKLTHRKLTKTIAEQQGKNKHPSMQDYISEDCRASVSRSTRRLEERGLIAKDIFGDVYLPEAYPGDFQKHLEMRKDRKRS